MRQFLVTKDCFDNQFTEEETSWTAELGLHQSCHRAGLCEGAMPGDVLKVKIEDIRVASWGTMAAIPDNGVLGTAYPGNGEADSRQGRRGLV